MGAAEGQISFVVREEPGAGTHKKTFDISNLPEKDVERQKTARDFLNKLKAEGTKKVKSASKREEVPAGEYWPPAGEWATPEWVVGLCR